MKNFTCHTCGSNKFRKEKEEYICDYCGATLVKQESYPKKRIVFILIGIAVLIFVAIMSYQLLHSVKQDISDLAKTQKQTNKTHYSSNSKQSPIIKDDNPFSDVILKVEGDFKKDIKGNALEEALKTYLQEEKNKAFYISLQRDGYFAYGYAVGAKTTKIAENKALKKCKKMKQKNSLKESCIPYAINNKVSHFIID